MTEVTDEPELQPALVRLRITEAGPEGRSMDLLQPRRRAEAIVHEGLRSWPRYRFEILRVHPRSEPPMKLVKSALAFAMSHKSEIGAALAYVASVLAPIPNPAVHTLSLVAAGLAAFAGSKYGGK